MRATDGIGSYAEKTISLPGKAKSAVLLAALILNLIPSAEAALLCSYSGPYISSDYLEVSDFRVTGPEPLKVGDTVTVSFTLESVKDPVRFGDHGVFVAAEDPDGICRDFGYAYRTDMLREGGSINFEASMTVDKEGDWTLSPVYSTGEDDTVYVGYRFESKYANPEIGDYFSVRSSGTKCMVINGKPNLLSPIILEMGEDKKQTLVSGGSWDLGNGYRLVVGAIDLDGGMVWLSLVKDGEEVESSVLKLDSSGDRFANRMFISGSPGAYRVVIADVSTTSTFVYQKDVGSEEDVPIFSVYVDVIFRGTTANIIQLKYAMLIDDDLIETDTYPDDVFRVMIEAEKRNPPATPNKPSGTLSGQTETSYTYSTSATDPDNDQIKYTFDWSGTNTTTDYVDSGSSVRASHSWTDPGSYIVKVKAVDSGGIESGWSEGLTVTITTPNVGPNTPNKPSGTSSGQTETSYTYSTSVTDPDNDQVKYIFDWDDGNSITTDYVDSGLSASASHSWTDQGDYIIRVKAVDSGGLESEWSDGLAVTITTGATEFPSDPTRLDDEERETELVQIIGVILVIAGLLFTALTAVKKDVTIELGVSERTIKYVGGTGIVLIVVGVYVLLKSAGLI